MDTKLSTTPISSDLVFKDWTQEIFRLLPVALGKEKKPSGPLTCNAAPLASFFYSLSKSRNSTCLGKETEATKCWRPAWSSLLPVTQKSNSGLWENLHNTKITQKWKTISTNCENQKTGDVSVSAAAEDAVCLQKVLVLLFQRAPFLGESFSKTVKLRRVSTHQKFNPMAASYGPELRLHF